MRPRSWGRCQGQAASGAPGHRAWGEAKAVVHGPSWEQLQLIWGPQPMGRRDRWQAQESWKGTPVCGWSFGEGFKGVCVCVCVCVCV